VLAALPPAQYAPTEQTTPPGAVELAGQCDPGGAAQLPEHAAAANPVTFPNVPAGHGVGAVDPAGQYDPAGQTVIAPAAQKDPSGHAPQTFAPAAAHVPAAHCAHAGVVVFTATAAGAAAKPATWPRAGAPMKVTCPMFVEIGVRVVHPVPVNVRTVDVDVATGQAP
jgi:hypothetical protein